MGYSREELKTMHIGVLLGGRSAERAVSLNSGAAVAKALRSRGYHVTEIDVGTDLAEQIVRHGVNLAFNILHGTWGEDGAVQGLCEVMGVPYTGSGVLASALAMNKWVARGIFLQAGLPMPDGVLVRRERFAQTTADDIPFGLPAVVKPVSQGSSVGVSIVRSPEKLAAALAEVAIHHDDALVERFIPGREVQTAVLDDEAIGAIEVVPAEEFYNFAAKYTAGTTTYRCPAPLPPDQYEAVCRIGLQAHRALGCQGVSRVDLIISTDGAPYLLEVNTLPGMTETSLVPKIAAWRGMSYEDLCEAIACSASLKLLG